MSLEALCIHAPDVSLFCCVVIKHLYTSTYVIVVGAHYARRHAFCWYFRDKRLSCAARFFMFLEFYRIKVCHVRVRVAGVIVLCMV